MINASNLTKVVELSGKKAENKWDYEEHNSVTKTVRDM